ncbi:MAG: hypothetical protein AAF065_06360 [Verrucomicrobiota bacterium]
MKNLILSIIFLSAATFLGLHLYKKGKDVEWIDVEESAPTYLFPARMELESADGRRVDVIVVARNDKYVQFVRNYDREKFVYSLNQLTGSSRKEVMRYPNTGLKDAGQHVADGSLTKREAQIEETKEALSAINRRVEDLSRVFEQSENPTNRSEIMRQIETLERQLQEQQYKLEALVL